MLPGHIGEERLGFDFYVIARLGRTKHQFRYVLQGDHWEFARRVMDITTSEVYEETVSPGFPRDDAGQADHFVSD